MGEEINFQPINRDVLLKLPEVSKTTEAGIIKSQKQLDEEISKQDKFLLVVEASNSCEAIIKGDKVLIGGGKHPQIELEGNFYIIVNELAILGKRKE